MEAKIGELEAKYVGKKVKMNPDHEHYDEYLFQHEGCIGEVEDISSLNSFGTAVQWENGESNGYFFDSLLFLDDEGNVIPAEYTFKRGYTVLFNPESQNCEEYMTQHEGETGTVFETSVGQLDTLKVYVQWKNGFKGYYYAKELVLISTDISELIKKEEEEKEKLKELYKYPWFPGTKVKVKDGDDERIGYIVDLMLSMSSTKKWHTHSIEDKIHHYQVKVLIPSQGRIISRYYKNIEKIDTEEILDVTMYGVYDQNYYSIDGVYENEELAYRVIERNYNIDKRIDFNKKWRDEIIKSIDSNS